MSEYTLEDGRKAEKVENNVDPMTKVVEIYVEPKAHKKLAQRVTERLCVCEREVETIDESTGEVLGRIVESLCSPSNQRASVAPTVKSPILAAVESKIINKRNVANYLFVAVILAQLAVLAYVTFAM